MELRLSKFITAVEKIADAHNLDYSNPFIYNMPHPMYSFNEDPAAQSLADSSLINQEFRMVVAFEEPKHLGLPINAIWINMQPNSMYYRTALKLKSVDSPLESGVEGAITSEGLSMTWIPLSRYSRLFDEQQISTSEGTQGPKGPHGDKGIVHMLAWDSARTYLPGQGVMHNGGFWVAKQTNTNRPPSNNLTDWQQLSARGELPEVDYEYLLTAVKQRLGWTT